MKINISRMKPFIPKYERPIIPPDNVIGEVPGFDEELPVDSWEEGQKEADYYEVEEILEYRKARTKGRKWF